MNETRKEIISLISDYMYKTLSEGCLIQTDGYTITISEEDIIENSDELVLYRKNEDEFYCIDEIIGHYELSALLKYITTTLMYRIEFTSIGYNYIYLYNNGERVYDIPNKPLYLYTEQEEKELLDLLLKG